MKSHNNFLWQEKKANKDLGNFFSGPFAEITSFWCWILKARVFSNHSYHTVLFITHSLDGCPNATNEST